MTTEKTSEKKPIIRSPYVRAPSRKFLVLHWLLKLLAMAVGLVGTIVSLMATVGAVVDTFLVRVGAAVVIAFVVPLVVAGLLAPKGESERRRGLISDVLAVSWLGYTFVFAFALSGITSSLLGAEAVRLKTDAPGPATDLVVFLAGPAAVIAAMPPKPAASAPVADAGAAPMVESDAASPVVVLGAGAHSATKDRDPAELFKSLAPSVVSISVRGKRGEGGGTGFLIDTIGTIATNHHVIDQATDLRIKFMDGSRFDVVDLLVDDASNDLALLRVDLSHPSDAGTATSWDKAPGQLEAHALTLGDSDSVAVGERAISIGNPLGLEHTLTDGLVSARRVYEGKHWIQMSVPVSPGNSGGPLFNMRGEVIGITTGQIGSFLGQAQNLNLAVPVNVLKAMIKPSYPERHRVGDAASSTQW